MKEENRPLLVFLVDADSENDQKTVAQGGEQHHAGIRAATAKLRAIQVKGRDKIHSLTSGTANIMKMWPEHITTYTLTLSMVILSVILLVNLSVYLVRAPVEEVLREIDKIKEECYRQSNVDFVPLAPTDKKPKAYLYLYINKVPGALVENEQKYLIDSMQLNDRFQVQTIRLVNDTSDYIARPRYTRLKMEHYPASKHHSSGFVQVKPHSLSEFFESSPLGRSWYKLARELVPFAVMVTNLWEQGGLSIDLEKFNNSINRNSTGGSQKRTFHNQLLDIPGDSYEDDTMDSEPSAFLHLNSGHVDNIQDVIRYKTGGFTPVLLNLNTSAIKTEIVTDFKPTPTDLINNTMTNQSNLSEIMNNATEDILGPVLRSDDANRIRSAEKEDRRKMELRQGAERAFPFLVTPKEDVAMIDRDGMFLSVKAPCHAFLGQLIQQMHLRSDYRSAKDVIEEALSVFCQKSDRRQEPCAGVELF